MQKYVDTVSKLIPQIDKATSITTFEHEAKLMLALDRAIVLVALLLGILINVGERSKTPSHPLVTIVAVAGFLTTATYFLLYPYAPEPPDPYAIGRRNLYPIMTGTLAGFTVVHAIFSLLSTSVLLVCMLVIVRFRALAEAYRNECMKR